MKVFLIRLTALIVCLICVDFLFGLSCDYCIKNARTTGDTHKIDYTVNHTSEDILIFGSSRAHYHYIPQILTDSLGLTVYNCGLNSHGIYYAFGCLSMIIERYTPKLIIYDIVEEVDLAENKLHDDQNIRSLYRYNSNASVSKLIKDYSKRESLMIRSNFYKYNESFLNIYHDYLTYQPFPQSDGYTPSIGVIDEKNPCQELLELELGGWEHKKEYYMRSFIDICKTNDIKLVFLYSPKYYGRTPYASLLSQFFKEYDCIFLNYADDSSFLGNSLVFHDLNHLNEVGAEEYTKKIVSVLKPLVK